MSGVAVLIPVLNRPHRVEPLIESLRASERAVKLTAMFLMSPGDHSEAAAVAKTGEWSRTMAWASGHGDYPRKMNWGYNQACREDYEWVFLGADDLEFEPGWADIAIGTAAEYDVCVIGTNDTVNVRVRSGYHSTHSLVHRDYAECGTIDEKGKLLCEEYGHWWCDDEFIGTAQHRGVFMHVQDSIVRHLHPNYGYGLDDDTYRKGQSSVMADKRVYDARKHLWGK